MNPLWLKWINASVNKHFDDAKSSYALYIEGKEPDIVGLNSWAELRINGPEFAESLKNQWKVTLSVDVMCQAKTNHSDAYLIHRTVGNFQSAFTNININKHVDVEGSPYWFCLTRKSPVRVLQWGIMTNKVNVYASSLLAEFEGEFNGSN